MRDIFDLDNLVVAHIECPQLQLRYSVQIMQATHVFLKTFQLGQSVVTEVKFFQVDKSLETTDPCDSIGLHGKDFQVAECTQILLVRNDDALRLSPPVHESCSCQATARPNARASQCSQFADPHQRPARMIPKLTLRRLPPSSKLRMVSLHQSRSPSSIEVILFCTRYSVSTCFMPGSFGGLRRLLNDKSSVLSSQPGAFCHPT